MIPKTLSDVPYDKKIFILKVIVVHFPNSFQ
jgi:hypothetical protein